MNQRLRAHIYMSWELMRDELIANAGASINTSPSNSASNSSKVEKGSVPLIVAQGGAHKMKGNRDLERYYLSLQDTTSNNNKTSSYSSLP